MPTALMPPQTRTWSSQDSGAGFTNRPGGALGAYALNPQTGQPAAGQFGNLGAMNGGLGNRFNSAVQGLQNSLGQQKGGQPQAAQPGQQKGGQAPARLNPGMGMTAEGHPLGGGSTFTNMGPGVGGAPGGGFASPMAGSPNWSPEQRLAQQMGGTGRGYYDAFSSPYGAPRYGASQGFNRK